MYTQWTMSATVDTMSLPYTQTSLLNAAAAASAAAEERGNHSAAAAASSSSAAAGSSAAAAAAKALAAETVTAATTYTTPKRLAGLAAVTPSTLNRMPDCSGQEEAQDQSEGEEVVVSASSIEETVAENAAASAVAFMVAMTTSSAPAAPAATSVNPAISAAVAATKKISKAAISATPSIQLGPRVTPAARRNSPQTAVKQQFSIAHSSPVIPRNLGGALAKKGDTSESALAAVASAASSQQPGKQEECPFTPAAQNNNIPAPSSFLAAQISPLRSSSRRNGEKSKGVMMMAPREKTPPPHPASSGLDRGKLSPGMFLSPRTPKFMTLFEKVTKTSGMTPGFTPGLTPTNFASDFGRGHTKENSMNALDVSNVFAWLQSPGGQGLFSPGGGLNSLSVTNTPRGMYGFCGPPANNPVGQGQVSGFGPPKSPLKLAPSPNSHHDRFFAELEAGGDVGVNTPKIPESQRSMICISPLASKKSGKNKHSPLAVGGAPDTPMSINFSEVFASPRLPTPRLSRSMCATEVAVKNEDGMSSSVGHASPVASALHTAERDINLDDDLNALLQLAETTTPGGRPMTFMSPLLTNSLRRVTNECSGMVRNGAPPSSLQLPIISGSSLDGSPQYKLTRNGTSSGRNISPPHLSIRSTSSGGFERALSPPTKSSLKKKSKKRKSSAIAESPDQHHQQLPGYPHPNMMHYRHPHATGPPAPAHHGYYHHPGYPGHHTGSHHGHLHPMAYPPAGHPAPQQHYAYSEQQQPGAAAPAAVTSASPTEEPSPVKSSRKSKGSRRSGKSSRSKSASKTPIKAHAIKSEISQPTPATPSSSRKRVRKSSAKATSASKKCKSAVSDPADKERITAAIYAVNTVYGDGTEKEEKLAAATLRGVTMRPSKKWQAQLYYAGKSRYIGVFDSKEKASLAYEIAREVLKTDKGEDGPANAEETDRNVTLARKAAFAGVNEHSAN